MTPALAVRDLSVRWPGVDAPALDGVSLDVAPGRTLALVGESGSGKSTLALCTLRLLPAEARVEGHVGVLGQDVLAATPDALRTLRATRVGMVFQEPGAALHPLMTVGAQIAEVLRVHRGMDAAAARDRVVALLAEVGLPDPARAADAHPWRLSGGQRQRATLALALACDPALLVADEPTTALDVTVQAQILDLVRRLQARRGTAVLWVTHDLGVVAEIADDVAVLWRGRLVERGPVGEVFARPRHPHTRALLESRPTLERAPRSPRAAPEAATGAITGAITGAATGAPPSPTPIPALEARGLTVRHPVVRGLLRRVVGHVDAVADASLSIARGETLGLVGESGCGKSTLARALLRLVEPDAGEVRLGGVDLASLRGEDLRRARRRAQMVFQDPYAALDPRQRVGDAIVEALDVHGIGTPDTRRERAAALLAEVGLGPELFDRLPHALSGGQRQRVCIARALAPEPDVLLCDEPVSALDVTVQAQVLDLLAALRARRGLAVLLVSHDLAVVRQLADRIAVMEAGRIVEIGPADAVVSAPRAEATRRLLAAVPRVDPERMAARAGRGGA